MKRLMILLMMMSGSARAADRPNLLWLTCEDMSPTLGCYGDAYATSPNIDRFAAKSLRYLTVWSNAPVCAPARTTLITGVYPTSTGSQHMRSNLPMPKDMKMYPQLLREAGYYCTNNVKEDYNLLKPDGVWDESSARAHWTNRKPGQPFFAVFNDTITHESMIRRRPHTLVHDPAKVRVPAYHPDTPEVRHDWAQYYDNITTMDHAFGARLNELEDAGLADDTIVWFYSDHGSGMPRSKRWLYDSGLRVPLIVHVPEKWKHLAPEGYKSGGTTDRLVSFVDFAPTVLSLAGLEPPRWMQGKAFIGKFTAQPREYLFGFRDRMDERYDMSRSARDARYLYVRNYMPHRPQGQFLSYMFETPTTKVWKRLFDEGKLNAAQSQFFKPKPPEELYDTRSDPDNVKNLIESPALQPVLFRLRAALSNHLQESHDLGFLPEDEMHARTKGRSPYDFNPYESMSVGQVIRVADRASLLRDDALPRRLADLRHFDSVVRYWAALSFLMRGKSAVAGGHSELTKALADSSPNVRIVAAEALGLFGDDDDLRQALNTLRELVRPSKNSLFVAVAALNTVDELDAKAAPLLPLIRDIAANERGTEPRMGNYVSRLCEKIIADLETK